MRKKFFSTKKLAVLGVLTALSLITFLIENLLPPLIIPGAKIGLANIFPFIALVMYTPVEAFVIVAVRTLLGAIFAGNLSALMYSFTGGVVAMTVSSILFYCVHPKISVLSISVLSAVSHNLTQNVVFVILSSTPLMFTYAPYLVLLGILSGAFVGGVITVLVKRIPTNAFVRVMGVKQNKTESEPTADEPVTDEPIADDEEREQS